MTHCLLKVSKSWPDGFNCIKFFSPSEFSYGHLKRTKIMPQGVGACSTTDNIILETDLVLSLLFFSVHVSNTFFLCHAPSLLASSRRHQCLLFAVCCSLFAVCCCCCCHCCRCGCWLLVVIVDVVDVVRLSINGA